MSGRLVPRLLLGVDPGTRLAGWGVIEARGATLRARGFGVLKGGPRRTMSERLRAIFEQLEEVIATHRPEAAALEETFAGLNPRSAIAMGQGRGVALLALARAGLPIMGLSPNEIKKAVTGNGHATKTLVAKMVCARLGLSVPPRPDDVTDALAAAIALAQRLPLAQHLSRGKRR